MRHKGQVQESRYATKFTGSEVLYVKKTFIRTDNGFNALTAIVKVKNVNCIPG